MRVTNRPNTEYEGKESDQRQTDEIARKAHCADAADHRHRPEQGHKNRDAERHRNVLRQIRSAHHLIR